MSEKRIPTFTFSRRLGHTMYSVNVFSKDNEAATYEDKLKGKWNLKRGTKHTKKKRR